MIRVAISGLGRIGAQNDIIAAVGAVPRSHVGAVVANSGAKIVALVDPEPEARENVVRRWPALREAKLLGSLNDLETGSADVIAVAGTTAGREHDVMVAISRAPRIVIVEKPFAGNLASGRKLVSAADAAGVALRVNFPRRFDPGHRALQTKTSARPQKIVGRYSKGVRNYGSHLVDLLLDWYGPVAEVQTFGGGGQGDDPNISFRCGMAAGFDALALGIDGLGYDQFELEFYFSDKRVELINGGVEKRVSCAVQDLYYPGYAQLGAGSLLSPPQVMGGMTELYRAVADHLTNATPLDGCDETSALAGLAVIDAVFASLASGGSAVRLDAI